MTTEQQAVIITDMQLRALAKGVEIAALRAEVRNLQDLLDNKSAELIAADLKLDQQKCEFHSATLRYHLAVWWRKIW